MEYGKTQNISTRSRRKSLSRMSARLCDIHDPLEFSDNYVQSIEKSVHEEIKELQNGFHHSRKERFVVFKRAFAELIETSASLKNLLSEINAEYLRLITAVEMQDRQRACTSQDLKCAVGKRVTVENYKKRIGDLQNKAKIIKENNKQLQAKLKHLRERKKTGHTIVTEKKDDHMFKRSHPALPGLAMDEQTNIEILSSSLVKLKGDVRAIRAATTDRFCPKQKKISLKKEILKKEKSKNNVSRYNAELREIVGRLTIAVEAAKSAIPTFHLPNLHLHDVVFKALSDYEKMESSRRQDPLQHHICADDDDPLKKKESEDLVSYIEHFNDLFDFGLYDAAAIHAAASPLGILRTQQALQRFKEVENYNGLKSPLFLYCEALMTTSSQNCPDNFLQLTPHMSLECISCALKESGISLAIHWLNQPCVVTSVTLADFLASWCHCAGDCCCKCQALAEGIYREFDAHEQVAQTLAQQGKHHALIEYGITKGNFTPACYKSILQSKSTVLCAVELLKANLNHKNTETGVSYCSTVSILLGSNKNLLIPFLEHINSSSVHCSSGKKYTTSKLIFEEKPSDEMSHEKWNKVIDHCFSNNHISLAMEILSTLLVRQALNHAAISSSMDYIS